MTWAPDVPTEEEIEGFVEDLMAVTPEILGIDETLPGCEVIDMDPYGVGAGTLPRYIKVAIREYYQDVFYRGGLAGLLAGDHVTVTHLREGNRYEVTGAGGSSGTVPSVPNPTLQGQALVSNAVPEWIASLTPTWLGTHTWGSGFALMPTDAAGQDLGDATHRWDLYTQAVYFGGATGANVITVPDNVADALHVSDIGGLEYLRIVSTNANPYVLFDPAGVGVKVAIGLAIPNQQLTVEGTIDLKEQAAANADTVAYGQIWVKNTTPCELWFTDDTGTDIQLGLAGGGLPGVAGAGYVIVSTGVNAWAADQTPTWTGEHSFEAGIAFTGASGANEITVPDNTAIALELLDAGRLEYVRIVTTNATPYVLIDPGAVGTIKVGIGIAAPATNLHIYESNADTEPTLRIEQGSTGDAAIKFRLPGVISWSMGIDNSDNDNFKIAEAISVSGSTFVIQRTTHNVGIGIAAPTASLHVTGTTLDTTPNVAGIQLAVESNYAAIELAGSTGGYIDFSPGDGTDYGGRIRYAHSNDYLYFYTAGAFAACISGSGKVGIGISIPEGTMHVWTATAGAVVAHGDGDDLIVENSAAGGISILVPDNQDANLYFGSPSDNIGAMLRWEYDQDRMIVGTADANGVLSLCSGNTVEAIQISSSQRVGIGCTPSYRLDTETNVAGGFVANFFNDGDNINRYGIRVQAGADIGGTVGTTFYFYATDGDGNVTGTLLTVDGVFQLADNSDESRKVNIRDTKIVGLGIVNGLRVRDYNWKSNPEGPVMNSFVAQEVQKVFPAMVVEALDGTLMTTRAMLIPILTKAIQELDARLTQGGL